MDWLTGNKNRKELEKLQEKRAILVIDVIINGKHKKTYKQKLEKINKEIEKVYCEGECKQCHLQQID